MTNTIEPVRSWLEQRNPTRGQITDDVDLIEGRLVDSLSFVEFLYVLQEASGKQIDPESLELEDIRTLCSMRDAFFTVKTGG
jgi:acyl carrier protein